jgi:hypothetical protein
MLRSIKSIQDYKIKTLQDEHIGTVQDFYFDGHDWTICYLVVDIEPMVSERKALISPEVITGANWTDQSFNINFTPDQIMSSPAIDIEQPITLQAVKANSLGMEESEAVERNHSLQSMKKVLSYTIQARDGDAGHIEDFLVDDQNWMLQYLVVDTRNWLPGRKVMVSPSWIDQIDEAEALIHINLSQETIKNSPEYDPAAPPEQQFEEKVYEHQDQSRY